MKKAGCITGCLTFMLIMLLAGGATCWFIYRDEIKAAITAFNSEKDGFKGKISDFKDNFEENQSAIKNLSTQMQTSIDDLKRMKDELSLSDEEREAMIKRMQDIKFQLDRYSGLLENVKAKAVNATAIIDSKIKGFSKESDFGKNNIDQRPKTIDQRPPPVGGAGADNRQ
ncbi:MAG: hypothetical protein GY858_08165 [Candidatus Omnitrophica bacterium]|nr:hypothetical protein [Candidatus Omnitrophota bacterium]